MKRIAFILNFVLLLLAAASCGSGASGDSVASYSKEIRVDDPQ